MSIPSAISSTVGSRPSSWSSAVERLGVALLDALGERHLLLPRDQRVLADFAQVLIERAFVGRCPFRRIQLHGAVPPRTSVLTGPTSRAGSSECRSARETRRAPPDRS